MMGRLAGQNRLRAAVRALSESEADNRVCQRIAGRIACITSTTKGGKTMATRTGAAVWEGTLKQGKGTMKLGSGAFEGPYSFSSRFEEAKGTNPEEIVGGGPKITTIDLKTEANVPGIDEAKFREQAELTKKTCPVSVALAGTQINLDAKLL